MSQPTVEELKRCEDAARVRDLELMVQALERKVREQDLLLIRLLRRERMRRFLA